MPKIEELIEKRATIWEQAKALLDKSPDGVLSPEDDAKFTQMTNDMDNISKSIDRLQKMQKIDDQLKKPTSDPIITPIDHTGKSNAKNFRATEEYRVAALGALRSNFRNVSNVLQEGDDASGGYLVPDEWDKRLINVLDEENIMRKLGHRIKTSGDHKINIAATKPTASWVEEGGEFKFSDATFDQKILDAHKLHVGIKVTEELLYDNQFDLESYILNEFGKALANAEEDAFLNGDGKHKPFGIFHATEGGQRKVFTDNVQISSDDLIDLIYTLNRPYRKRSSFVMNDMTVSSIRKLKDSTGHYLWQPALTAGEPDRLLGYPLYTSAYAPLMTAGSACISFGDYSYYNIGDRGVRSYQELKELFAGNGMVGFLMKERVDGRLVLSEAVQVLTVKSA